MSTEHLLGDISVILDALIGVDNAQRQEAEKKLDELIKANAGGVLLLLAQVGAQGVGGFQLDQRLLALILLRRVSFKYNPNPFDHLPETTRTRIEKVLIAGLRDEMDPRLRKGLGVCVAEWIKASQRRNRPFTELQNLLLELAVSQHPFHRFTPFQLLDLVPNLLSSGTNDGTGPRVAELLLGGIQDPSVDVKVEALKAMRGVLDYGLSTNEREAFGPGLVSNAFEILPNLPDDVKELALQPLIDVASNYPELFQPTLPTALPFLLTCISPSNTAEGSSFNFSRYHAQKQMDFEVWEGVANMAYEILNSLIVSNPIEATTWENGYLTFEIVNSLISRQIASFAHDDCTDWVEEQNLDDEDETYPAYSEEMLDRLAQILQDSLPLKAVVDQASILLKQDDWRAKYCSLTAIGTVAAGTAEYMKRDVRGILELISPAVTDQHARVRYGFLFAISQLCTHLEGVMQNEYSDAVLDVALRLLEDPVARVREAAAALLIHFYDYNDAPVFENRLEQVLTALMNAFIQPGPNYIKEQILSAIGSIATHSGPAFVPYYRKIMDMNLRILTAPPEKTAGEMQKRLVGRSMRCASLIAEAVGKEHSYKDTAALCQAFLTIQNSITAPDDSRRPYLGDAWLGVARTIGQDFAPFLQFVIPPLLHAASYVPPPPPEDDEDADAFYYHQSAEMVEKEESFNVLASYVHEMRAAFAPYLSDTMAITLNALDSTMSEGVRESAYFLIPGLLQVSKDAHAYVSNQSSLEQLFSILIQSILHVDASSAGQIYQSIGDSIRVLNGPIPEVNLKQLIQTTHAWLEALLQKRQDRIRDFQGGKMNDFGWIEIEKFEEDMENQSLHIMDNCFGRIVKLDGLALGEIGQVVPLANKVKETLCYFN